MFENIVNFFKNMKKNEKNTNTGKSKEAAKERLHLVLMQDRANVSADFLDLMKQEIIEVIKKYIDVDENAIDVRLTNKANGDGTNGAPALYANIPIVSIKEDVRNGMARQKQENKENTKEDSNIVKEKKETKEIEKKEEKKEEQGEQLKEEKETVEQTAGNGAKTEKEESKEDKK